jgi:hypothetical protein
MPSLSVCCQRILTQQLSLWITGKSYCHILFSRLVMPTLQNWVQFSNPPISSRERELLYDWRLAANQFVLAPGLLRPMTRNFFRLNSLCNILSDEKPIQLLLVIVKLRLTVSQSARLGVEPHVGLMTRYLLLFDSHGLVFMGRPHWREDESVFCQSHCLQQ